MIAIGRGFGNLPHKLILFGENKTPENVVVSWVVESGRPRMTGAYIKEVKEHGR